jgi:hypothetical protein
LALMRDQPRGGAYAQTLNCREEPSAGVW